ncbi:MAG: hypothetical protein GC155_01130 [Alphaproteobacteria bacterium]|nr:hypothetical protein [Alphaproteobacteria bacterium]
MICRFLPGVALVALAACATPNKAYYGRDYCENRPSIASPDALCWAYYKQFRTSHGGASTMLIVYCKQPDGSAYGVGTIRYAEHPERGPALRWLSNDQLEVSLPAGATLSHSEREPNSNQYTFKPGPAVEADLSPTRIVHLTYRNLTPADRNRSCYARWPKSRS